MSEALFTQEELAKKFGQWKEPRGLTQGGYSPAHRGAAVKFGWTAEENVTGQPVMLSEEDYKDAIADINPAALKG